MPVAPLQSLRSIPRFIPMSLNSFRQPSSSSLPSFRRIFPFKLKYLGLNPKLGFAPRNLSTRSFKSRPNSEPKYNRTEGPKAAPLSKSLIEDEDDLSDWVSGLRTSSIKSGVFTEDEDEDDDRGKLKKKGQLGKRGRESYSDFGGSDEEEKGFRQMGKKGFRNSSNLNGNVKDSSRFGRRFGGEDEGNERRIRGGAREFGARGGQSDGNRGGAMRASGERSLRGEGNRGGGRIGREREIGVRDGMKGKEREFGGRNGWGEGNANRGGGRMGREREFGGRNARNEGSRGGGRMDKGGRKGTFVSESEEDEFELRNGKEKSVSGFLDLIGEEDSDVDDEEEEEEEANFVVRRSRSSLFANESEKLSSGTGSSSISGDSYLSETRLVHLL